MLKWQLEPDQTRWIQGKTQKGCFSLMDSALFFSFYSCVAADGYFHYGLIQKNGDHKCPKCLHVESCFTNRQSKTKTRSLQYHEANKKEIFTFEKLEQRNH